MKQGILFVGKKKVVIRVGERSSECIRHVRVVRVIDGSTQHGGYCEDQQLGGWKRRSRGRTASSSEDRIEINRMFDTIFVHPSLSCLGYIY